MQLEKVAVDATIGAHEETPDQVGLAELVRHCLSGGGEETPLPADIDGAVYAALLRATRPRPNDRFRDLPEFVAALAGVTAVAQPLRPTIPVGKRIRPTDWDELLETEPETTPAARRPVMLRVAVGVALLVLVTAAVPFGRRLMRPADGRISYPSASLVVSPAEEIAPVTDPPPPAVETLRPVLEPKRTPTRTPAPAPAPGTAPVRTPAPTLAPAFTLPPVPAAGTDEGPGTLSLSSTPWGEVSIDGTPMGNTPQLSVPLAPGRHQIRLTRDGYEPFTIEVQVRPGEAIRLTQLALKELKL